MPDGKATDADITALGRALHADPALRQAALSGMASGIQGHLTKTGSGVHPSVIAGVGKLQQIGTGGGTSADVFSAGPELCRLISTQAGKAGEETAG